MTVYVKRNYQRGLPPTLIVSFLFEDSIFSAAVLNRVTDFLATVLKRVPQTKDLHRNGLFFKIQTQDFKK
ncbi:hypothetical protein AYR62_05335 [Secundilactobacillus paracollinoides]|nr:hypothetical protein AYR62_05335 [Secundilactobacillus paracollinoides]